MTARTETWLTRPVAFRDPFALLRQMTPDFERMLNAPFFSSFRSGAPEDAIQWAPTIDVFEKDKRLITRVDLPGVTLKDVKVEVSDGNLMISGERKREYEDQKENMYRCEREYGTFFRSVPLPEGVTLDDVTATFTDGVLEVSVPLPATKPVSRTVEIKEPAKQVKGAA